MREMIDRQDFRAWSILAPTPQCYYHADSRSHIVYWQGIVMTRVHAMMLVQEHWLMSWATPRMKIEAFKEFKRVYLTKGFGNVHWHITDDLNHDSYMIYLRRNIVKNNDELFEKLSSDYTIKDAMMWFSDKNEELIT